MPGREQLQVEDRAYTVNIEADIFKAKPEANQTKELTTKVVKKELQEKTKIGKKSTEKESNPGQKAAAEIAATNAKKEVNIDFKAPTKTEAKVDAKDPATVDSIVDAKADVKVDSTKVDVIEVDTLNGKKSSKINDAKADSIVDTKDEMAADNEVDIKINALEDIKIVAKVDTAKVDAELDTKGDSNIDAQNKADAKVNTKVDVKSDANAIPNGETKINNIDAETDEKKIAKNEDKEDIPVEKMSPEPEDCFKVPTLENLRMLRSGKNFKNSKFTSRENNLKNFEKYSNPEETSNTLDIQYCQTSDNTDVKQDLAEIEPENLGTEQQIVKEKKLATSVPDKKTKEDPEEKPLKKETMKQIKVGQKSPLKMLKRSLRSQSDEKVEKSSVKRKLRSCPGSPAKKLKRDPTAAKTKLKSTRSHEIKELQGKLVKEENIPTKNEYKIKEIPAEDRKIKSEDLSENSTPKPELSSTNHIQEEIDNANAKENDLNSKPKEESTKAEETTSETAETVSAADPKVPSGEDLVNLGELEISRPTTIPAATVLKPQLNHSLLYPQPS